LKKYIEISSYFYLKVALLQETGEKIMRSERVKEIIWCYMHCKTLASDVILRLFTVVRMMMIWVLSPCRLVDRCQHFGERTRHINTDINVQMHSMVMTEQEVVITLTEAESRNKQKINAKE
jgi:hypothetical protein